MLIRISLILAIIAGLAVAALNFTMVKEKVTTLKTELATETEAHKTSENNFLTTKRALATTTAQLTQTNMELVASLSERDRALTEASAATKRATDLSDRLTKTTKDLSDAKDAVAAYEASGLSAVQVLALAKDLKTLQENLAGQVAENKVLGSANAKLQAKLDIYEGKKTIVYLPQALKGKVVVADPKWDFVVLDVGENQGVLERGELLVSRSGKLVAKVIVRSIEKDRCIANVMPGWKLGEVLEGDQVIPAHPAS